MNKEGLIYRGIVAKQPIFLKTNMDHYELLKKKFNIYQSIAKYSWMPVFSWDIKKRQTQYTDWFGDEKSNIEGRNKKYINGYDFYMDFDNKGDDKLVKEECRAISEYLTTQEIAHSIRFSGSGYHLKAEFVKEQENPESSLKFASILKEKYGLTTPDFSIYRWNAIIKVPYSVDCKTMNICLPIPLDELKTFDKTKAHITNFLSKNGGE